MKTLITLISFSAFFGTFAQTYDDLQILYADGSYEKLVAKAIDYTLKEKTSKDVPPYFWAAKGLYKISLSGTTDEKYKNAYKDAITYLGKGIKYDLKSNDGATIADEREFLDEFQMSLVETIENEIASGGWKKAYSWAIKYVKVTTDNTGSLFMQGACKAFDNDKTSARDLWNQGEAGLKSIESIDNWSDADKKLLKLGVLHSAAALKQARQVDKAKTLVGKVSQWYENDPDWQSQYDAIVNGVE